MNSIYLDACLYIYYLENHHEFGASAARFFEKAEAGKHFLVASPLILHEILSGLYGQPDIDTDQIYGLLVTYPGIRWIDYSIEIADLSAQLRAESGVRTPDSIHLATAIFAKCQNFITNDRRLEKIKLPDGIRVSLL